MINWLLEFAFNAIRSEFSITVIIFFFVWMILHDYKKGGEKNGE